MRKLSILALTLAALIASVAMTTDGADAQAEVRYNFTSSDYSSAVPRTSTRAAILSRLSGRSAGYSGKRIVDFSRPLARGTILINTAERRLYYVLGDGQAIQYGIGVGRDGFTWRGRKRISRKAEWPGWTPPKRMIERERAKGRILPAHMPGGPDNPLGARALYLGASLYRIHGTNQPHTIGRAVSSGCIRMLNDEVIDLYSRVKVGTPVIVE